MIIVYDSLLNYNSYTCLFLQLIYPRIEMQTLSQSLLLFLSLRIYTASEYAQ